MNPSTVPPQETPTQSVALQKQVKYGKGILTKHTGTLNLDSSGRLWLVDDSVPQTILFDLPANQIVKVGGHSSVISITMANRGTYTFNFSDTALQASTAASFGLGGMGGMIADVAINKRIGIYTWLDEFRRYGVKVTYWTNRKLILVALLAFPVFVFIPMIILLIILAFSA